MKVLVANRSEIACRVFQTAKAMGMQTVAIYTAADSEARHLTFADERIEVESYLSIEEIVRAAQKSGADLVHPGYGFLSERAPFVRALEKAGIGFVGPTPETMEALGEKISAKKVAEKANVPTLPWAKVSDLQSCLVESKKIGFPLLLKAAAGGGGKGMRRVDSEAELEEAAESAAAEAISSFGDGTLFIEKLLEKPRHIEVQVFGDGRGNGIHFYERECSLQRRHQKVWEEAPALFLSDELKEKIHQAAVSFVETIGYRNAGTVEFLVEGHHASNPEFYFLEMNTRLQVEHPVTESITGVDLVWEQLSLAKDPKNYQLPVVPESRGHSIEVRLYAEDPSQGFMPTPGTITQLVWPLGEGIRIDSGIEVGQTITTGFDPMLAKLIVSASNRDRAVSKMRETLKLLGIVGIGTNQAYLQAIADHPAVIEGKIDTEFLERELGSFDLNMNENQKSLLFQLDQQGWGVQLEKQSSSSFASPWRNHV
ncbi:MAG: hypothetical protein CL678_13225 [Bdellovibrionaceae bacterium]|nr:hypothetical protein [Pseudobdellovibrionaceae bacterium]|tara:strand:- start:855 stop:2303 length:1449 start_codon:yes stop_codon:yes gene_type:complete